MSSEQPPAGTLPAKVCRAFCREDMATHTSGTRVLQDTIKPGNRRTTLVTFSLSCFRSSASDAKWPPTPLSRRCSKPARPGDTYFDVESFVTTVGSVFTTGSRRMVRGTVSDGEIWTLLIRG